MVDLVCKRYPGTKPSDYLDIDDPFIALQLDYAVAYKHDKLEKDEQYERFKMQLKANGMEIQEKKTAPELVEPPVVDDLMRAFGGKGVVVRKNG